MIKYHYFATFSVYYTASGKGVERTVQRGSPDAEHIGELGSRARQFDIT